MSVNTINNPSCSLMQKEDSEGLIRPSEWNASNPYTGFIISIQCMSPASMSILLKSSYIECLINGFPTTIFKLSPTFNYLIPVLPYIYS